MRDIELEEMTSGANEFGRLIQEDRETLVPPKVENNLMLDMVKVEPEFESESVGFKEDEEERWTPNEHSRSCLKNTPCAILK
jgi:3-methyladenine DNA glycosylase AlkC